MTTWLDQLCVGIIMGLLLSAAFIELAPNESKDAANNNPTYFLIENILSPLKKGLRKVLEFKEIPRNCTDPLSFLF